MNYKPIIILSGEPNSIFFEIFFKSLKNKKYKSPIILIASKELLFLHMKILKVKVNIKLINDTNFNINHLSNTSINLINVEYKYKINKLNDLKKFPKITNIYIDRCFNTALKIIKLKKINKFINGPIVKKNFLRKKFLGVTKFLAKKTNTKKFAMLIYNKKLSVCPITTHLPINQVSKFVTKKNIIEKINLINSFYVNKFNKKPRIAVAGLNPHCETVDKINEDDQIIRPTINILKKKKIKISGPYPSDTLFIRNIRNKFDVIVGMYHDQVLTPIKTIFEYDAINITLGLPFNRISPDHGPNIKMVGKNLSSAKSLIKSIEFLDF